VNVGWEFPHILVYSDIFIPWPDTIRLFIPESGYLFITTATRNTSMLHSRALGGVFLPRWFLVDILVEPQWVNMHLLPPLIDDNWGESKMTPRLTVLVKQVAELRDTSLWTCHCAEEFTLQGFTPWLSVEIGF
jgi:hypothetical protein